MKEPVIHYYDTTSTAAPRMPGDEVERFLADRTFLCEALRCRMQPGQCEHNRKSGSVLACLGCRQERPAVEVPAPVKYKRRRSDNPASPWRKNPGFIPSDRRPAAVKTDRQTDRQTDTPSPRPDFETMRIYRMVCKRLGRPETL